MYRMHETVALDSFTREYYKEGLLSMGLTDDEAEMMLDDFEAGY